MNILSIDYGDSKIGFAIGDTHSRMASPLHVFRYKTIDQVISHINKLIVEHSIQKIVVGVSEGKTAEQTSKFVSELKKIIQFPIHLYDETLSTFEAQELSREAGMNRKKRKGKEDAFAAAIILEKYLDS